MTSTYRPLFLGFFGPAFRGPGAPNKSSILVALFILMLVDGLLGGAETGGPPSPGRTALVETDRARLPGPDRACILSIDCAVVKVPAVERGGSMAPTGRRLDPSAAGGGVFVTDGGGGGVPPTEREIPARGGGGVAFLASTFSAPGFLLIQRPRSGS